MRSHVARRTASTTRFAAGLLLLLTTLCLHADALKSDVGKRLAVVADAQSPSQLQQPSEIDDHHEHDEGDAVVRCRFCGAAVALKK